MNPTEFEIVTSVDVLDLYRHPEDIPVGLTLGDTRLLVAAYDVEGQLQACLASTNPDLYEWAHQLFERYYEQAGHVEPSVSLPFHFGNREE